MVWAALTLPNSGHLPSGLFLGLLYNVASQSVVWGWARLAARWNVLEMQTPGPHAQPTESESLHKICRWFGEGRGVLTAVLELRGATLATEW